MQVVGDWATRDLFQYKDSLSKYRKFQQVQLERLRSENTPALSPWTNFKLGLP